MNYQGLEKMCGWERSKAIFLLSEAERLNMDLDSYGEIAVNQSSGYTYLWLEDYPFTLYMPISCELKKEDVMVMWTNPEDGEEVETELENKSLNELYDWVKEQEKVTA